jgi:putative spermidine/putrescine transport system ATP-binding protein
MAKMSQQTVAPAQPIASLRQPKLLVDGISKRYGSVTALESIHLGVEAGELLTVLGPSGSGKTTLLQIICGLVEPSEGRLLIDGVDVTHTPVHRRDIGLVFQNYALFPHMTVAENVGFPLKMRRHRAKEIRERVNEVLTMVRLDQLNNRYPRELSGGQQQRVALARCFVFQPSLILMDEPLGALDKKLREHMQIEIKSLHRTTGTTIIYVTHDQEEALALSDRICVMNHAHVEQVGPPRDIYSHPRTVFAAEFIGTSNALAGRLVHTAAGNRTLVAADGVFQVPSDTGLDWQDGTEARLIVRPEHLEMDLESSNRLTGRVIETVYAGSETRLLIGLTSGLTATVRLPAYFRVPAIGDVVNVGWRTEAAALVRG